MGLYIKDLEMPECCTTCMFCDHDVECCKLSWRRVAVDGRREDCPLVYISSDSHLIDADELAFNLGDIPHKGLFKRILLQTPSIIQGG